MLQGSVSVRVNSYGLDGPGIEFRCVWGVLYPSRRSLGPMQLPIQWVSVLCLVARQPGLSNFLVLSRHSYSCLIRLASHNVKEPRTRRFPQKHVSTEDTKHSVLFIISPKHSVVPRGGVLGCSNPPPPEIPNSFQNRAKLNPICENC